MLRNAKSILGDEFCIIYGTSSKKDASECLKLLDEYRSELYLIEAKHFRAMKMNRLIEMS